ncbi:MAG TPA: DUF1269 domain-containing protein [Thermomicrobiales bacterium]|nr:DUF1269 domain-containing protein [Thermomicrobiales bacterium]
MAQPPWSTSRHASDDPWYAELEQLVQRYEHGEINDEQFAQEKQRILRRSRAMRARQDQLQIVTAVYDDEQEARAAHDALLQLHIDEVGYIVDAAVLRRDAGGAVGVVQYSERSSGSMAKRSALISVLTELIFPPAGVGGTAGSVAGALVSYLTNRGFDDRDLRALGSSLRPGQSAILVVAQTRRAGQLAGSLHSAASFSSYPLPGEIVTLVNASVDGDASIS